MPRFPARAVAASAAVAISLAACRSAPPASTAATSPVPAAAPIDGARYPYTAADVHFMSAMIGHHSQAIVMSRMAASHGASAEVRTLADRIVNAQEDDIRIMQRWLRDRAQPVPEPDTSGAAAPMPMEHMAGHAHGPMPGMLTAEQMRQLDAARGPEFDRLFLRFMIQHHRGAVEMVRQLFASQGAAEDDTVFKFASDVNVDQSTEIARMQRMLAAAIFERPAP